MHKPTPHIFSAVLMAPCLSPEGSDMSGWCDEANWHLSGCRPSACSSQSLLWGCSGRKNVNARLTCGVCLCRSGNPLLAMDLARVSVDVARAIVVLATAESPERSDARVLRIVLSLMGVHDRLKKSGIEGGLKVGLPGASHETLRMTATRSRLSSAHDGPDSACRRTASCPFQRFHATLLVHAGAVRRLLHSAIC